MYSNRERIADICRAVASTLKSAPLQPPLEPSALVLALALRPALCVCVSILTTLFTLLQAEKRGGGEVAAAATASCLPTSIVTLRPWYNFLYPPSPSSSPPSIDKGGARFRIKLLSKYSNSANMFMPNQAISFKHTQHPGTPMTPPTFHSSPAFTLSLSLSL